MSAGIKVSLHIDALDDGAYSVRWRGAEGAGQACQPQSFLDVVALLVRVDSGRMWAGGDATPDAFTKRGIAHPGYAAAIMPKPEMESLSFELSDFLCWAAGFNAALNPDDHSRRPLGVEAIRTLNLKLKSAIEKVKE